MEFEINLVWQGSRTSYQYEIDRRYDPPYVYHNIMGTATNASHDEQLALQYGLKYVVAEDTEEDPIAGGELIFFVEKEIYLFLIKFLCIDFQEYYFHH